MFDGGLIYSQWRLESLTFFNWGGTLVVTQENPWLFHQNPCGIP